MTSSFLEYCLHFDEASLRFLSILLLFVRGFWSHLLPLPVNCFQVARLPYAYLITVHKNNFNQSIIMLISAQPFRSASMTIIKMTFNEHLVEVIRLENSLKCTQIINNFIRTAKVKMNNFDE